MPMLDALYELLYPTRCVGCELPGELICEDCREKLPWISQHLACPDCGAPFGLNSCTECKHDWPSRACICAFSFADVAAPMVTSYKDHHELRLAPLMAAAMETALVEAAAWPAADGCPRFDVDAIDALAFVPASSEAFRRRGFDHMEGVARELSSVLSLPLLDALIREDAHDQRDLGRDERQRNLAGTMQVTGQLAGLDLLLIDDVITTGASIKEASEALLSAGAASVTLCALCRVW